MKAFQVHLIIEIWVRWLVFNLDLVLMLFI